MITSSVLFRCGERPGHHHYRIPARSILTLVLFVWLASGCAPLISPERQLDPEAERTAARLRHINADLTRFKCVGKMTLASPAQAQQSFRAAVAGQLSEQLRIDMFAPFGGAAGTLSSDGNHLFLVMHPSREYVKQRIGRGSLRRIIQMDITVGDLLEMLVGRIPMDDDLSARMQPDTDGLRSHLLLSDRRNRLRQRITLDKSMMPVRSEWFDRREQSEFILTVDGRQQIAGFVLPRRIELTGTKGARVSVVLERYEANPRLDEDLFVPARPSL